MDTNGHTPLCEDYVSFETAKLLKEKGFGGDCLSMYVTPKPHLGMGNPNEAKIAPHGRDSNYYEGYEYQCEAPTLQMAMKWLREVHNYDISICLDSYVEPYDNLYYIAIRRRKDKYENVSPCEQVYFDTYEEACEAAIKYCLENLI